MCISFVDVVTFDFYYIIISLVGLGCSGAESRTRDFNPLGLVVFSKT